MADADPAGTAAGATVDTTVDAVDADAVPGGTSPARLLRDALEPVAMHAVWSPQVHRPSRRTATTSSPAT
ncbi:hypothetical protein GCM10023215_13090 [Pseudonocardia yuanmonensis]|uniref:Uncharacterized protein n=1 Tax=Pseudonocardia yuanmonensis TaxID=1095914 RepID=A0ABP8W788_9PSEU